MRSHGELRCWRSKLFDAAISPNAKSRKAGNKRSGKGRKEKDWKFER